MFKNVCKVSVNLVRFLMNLELFQQIFEKYSYITFLENLSKGSQFFNVDERTQRQADRQTETQTTKLVVGFCNFANAQKKPHQLLQQMLLMPSLCHTAVCMHSSFAGTSSKEQHKYLPSAVALCSSSKSLHFYRDLCSYIQTVCFAFCSYRMLCSRPSIQNLSYTEYRIGYGDTLIFSIFAKGRRIS